MKYQNMKIGEWYETTKPECRFIKLLKIREFKQGNYYAFLDSSEKINDSGNHTFQEPYVAILNTDVLYPVKNLDFLPDNHPDKPIKLHELWI